MLPEDMTSLVFEFDNAGTVDVTYLRWLGTSTVIAGTAIDDGYTALTLSPQRVYYPRVPKTEIERLPVGDRQRTAVLVWSVAADVIGNTYDTLQTVNQAGRTRPDRIVDNDRGLTFEVAVQWTYGRQSFLAGAIGLLVQV